MPSLENNTASIALVILFAYMASIVIVTLARMRGERMDAVLHEVNMGLTMALVYSAVSALLLYSAHSMPQLSMLFLLLYGGIPVLYVLVRAVTRLDKARYTYALWFGTINQMLLLTLFLTIEGLVG